MVPLLGNAVGSWRHEVTRLCRYVVEFLLFIFLFFLRKLKGEKDCITKQKTVREATQHHQSTRDETLAINNATTMKMIAASKRKVILQKPSLLCTPHSLSNISSSKYALVKGNLVCCYKSAFHRCSLGFCWLYCARWWLCVPEWKLEIWDIGEDLTSESM
jgi:hypothetical protein